MAEQEVEENRWFKAEPYKVKVLTAFGNLPGVAREFNADQVQPILGGAPGQETGFRIRGPRADIRRTREELSKMSALVQRDMIQLGHPPDVAVDNNQWNRVARDTKCIIEAVDAIGRITRLKFYGLDQQAVDFFKEAVQDVDEGIQIIPLIPAP